MSARVRFLLNGEEIEIDVGDKEVLLFTLRDRLKITSVKEGCSIGECGACTVLIDDRPFYSCLTLSKKVQGRHVKTVEYLSKGGLHPIQEAFIEKGAVQCGFCTPGMVLSAYSLLMRKKDPDESEIKKAISGNLCRCTGYIQIIEAIKAASKIALEGESSRQNPEKIYQSLVEVFERLKGAVNPILYAGGTDILIKYRYGEIDGDFVDVTSVPELHGIRRENGYVKIGGASTHSEIAESDMIQKRLPSLSLACGSVGSPQIRNLGTLAGNIANASPAADTLPPLVIHDAMCVIQSPDSKRIVPLAEIIVGPYRNSLGKHELITEIQLKELEGYREGFIKVGRRKVLSISRLSLAYAIKEDGEIIEDLRIGLGSLCPRPLRPKSFEDFMRGKRKDRETIRKGCEVLFEEIIRVSGERPSYKYKFPVLRDLIFKIIGG